MKTALKPKPVKVTWTSSSREASGPWLGLSLFVGVAAISFAAVLVRLSVSAPPVVAAYRLSLSALMLLPVFATRIGYRYRRVSSGTPRPSGAAVAGIGSTRDLSLALCSGGVLGLHYILWFASLGQTTVASSTVLVTLHPLMILPVSYLLWGDAVSLRQLGGVVAALVGGALITGGDLQIGADRLLGDINALLAAVAMGVYLLIGAAVRRRMELLPYTLVVYGTGGTVTAVAAVLAGYSLWPQPLHEWLLFVALAAIPTLVGHTLFNWALRFTRPAAVSVSILGEPLGASLLAFSLFGEVPGWLQTLGGVLVLIGVYSFNRQRREERSA